MSKGKYKKTKMKFRSVEEKTEKEWRDSRFFGRGLSSWCDTQHKLDQNRNSNGSAWSTSLPETANIAEAVSSTQQPYHSGCWLSRRVLTEARQNRSKSPSRRNPTSEKRATSECRIRGASNGNISGSQYRQCNALEKAGFGVHNSPCNGAFLLLYFFSASTGGIGERPSLLDLLDRFKAKIIRLGEPFGDPEFQESARRRSLSTAEGKWASRIRGASASSLITPAVSSTVHSASCVSSGVSRTRAHFNHINCCRPDNIAAKGCTEKSRWIAC
ncbi:uncharacterized protein LOC129747325 [Uranotaenia lowii]|uniref:uncharacterized protein LOC129747325 n=1 Tax=Uranotaenia lowii TaxID=190385 RepID=UPI00247AD5C9|nr:uncharacterized protein LOC129747325 [Uranotaenia lowii]